MKLLLVTHFARIFPYDPRRMGQLITVAAILVAFLPCAAICAHETLQGRLMVHPVGYLSGLTFCASQGLPFLTKILSFWALVAMISLGLTLVYIRRHLQQQATSLAIRAGESNAPKKEVNLKRALLAVFAIKSHLIIVILRHYLGRRIY
jgi:hypothetical protein